MIACLGAWCASREECMNYQWAYGAGELSDKLCQIRQRVCGKKEEPESIGNLKVKTQWSEEPGQSPDTGSGK